MKRFYQIFFVVIFAALLSFAAGCGSSSSNNSNGDADTEADAENSESEIPADQDVIAYKIEDKKWRFGGPAGDGGAGDFMLKNKKVRFVVQGGGAAKSWIYYASALIDADIIRDAQLDGDNKSSDMLVEVSPLCDFLRAVKPTGSYVESDGKDGTAKVVVTGTGAGVGIIDAAIPMGSSDLSVKQEYILEENSSAIKIVTSVTNLAGDTSIKMGDGAFWLRRARTLVPGAGYGDDAVMGREMKYIVVIGDGLAYGYVVPTGTFKIPIAQANIFPLYGEKVEAKSDVPVSFTRYFVVGATVDEVLMEMHKIRGEAFGAVEVTVKTADANEKPGSYFVRALNAGGFVVSEAKTDANHKATFHLLPGTYNFVAGTDDRGFGANSAAATVTADGQTSAEVALDAAAYLHFTASGDSSVGKLDRLPVKVLFQKGLDAKTTDGIVYRKFSLGEDSYAVAPGDYTVTIARGLDYDVCRKAFTLEAGKTADFSCEMKKVIDTEGYGAIDLHMHTELSVDAQVPIERRIVQFMAEGLEAVSVTDHDRITDLRPTADSITLLDGASKASSLVSVFPGCEISPTSMHYNMHFVTKPDDDRTYFGLQWWKDYGYQDPVEFLTQKEIGAIALDKYKTKLLQINHPRMGQGYFSSIDYVDSEGPKSISPEIFDASMVNQVELLNGDGTGNALTKMLPTWYSFLNCHINFTGVGVSDSHVDNDPGYSRTYVYLGSDRPVKEGQIISAINEHKALAVSGPFVSFDINGKTVGETVKGSALKVHIKVQAPSWMALNYLKLIQNGEEIYSAAETDFASASGVRFEKTIDVTADKDSYFVALAGAPDKDLSPVQPGQAVLTITNAIWVDYNSDDAYDLPSTCK